MYREERYRFLADAAYKRRGWTRNGVPTMEKIKKLGIDWIPEVVDIVKKHEGSTPPKETLPISDEAWKCYFMESDLALHSHLGRYSYFVNLY